MISHGEKAIPETLGNSTRTGEDAELSNFTQLQEALAEIKKQVHGCWVSHVSICCLPLVCSLHVDRMEEKDEITIARNGVCCILCCPCPFCCDNVHEALLTDGKKNKISIAEYARRKGEGINVLWARWGYGEEKKDDSLIQCHHILWRKYCGCLYTAFGLQSTSLVGDCCCCAWFLCCDCRCFKC